MKTTITDLIYFLPIKQEVKAKLLSSYDSLDADKKLAVSKICWNMYHDLYDVRVQQEIQKALADSEIDPSKLSQQMVKDIEQKIHDEFQSQLILKQEENNIGQVRQDLESLVTNEISAPETMSTINAQPQPQNTIETPVIEPVVPMPEPPSTVEAPNTDLVAHPLQEPKVVTEYKTEAPSRALIQNIRSLLDELEKQIG